VSQSTDENVVKVSPYEGTLRGSVQVPGDKSISHRSILFSAMAEGTSRLTGVLDSEDVRSSIRVVQALGAEVSLEKQIDGSLSGGITGWGSKGPERPEVELYCKNSGTTARLLMGVLAPWDITATISGDASLSRRPMRRITAPLMMMGVHFSPEEASKLPIKETGTRSLKAISYNSPMASAQLKSAILLAGLGADGETTVIEPYPSRNHTELMLPEFGARTTAGERTASVFGPVTLHAAEVDVPGDPSSAAFLVCAAMLIPGSSIQIENVDLNTARVGFVRTLERMGGEVSVRSVGLAGKEPYGVISASYTEGLHGCEIPADKIPSEIDEVPILSLVAARARGITVFRGISELRVKETNRVKAVMDGLGQMGVDSWVEGEDLFIEGQPNLKMPKGLVFESNKDHRLAMTWAIAGLTGDQPVSIRDFDSVKVSFPQFMKKLEELER